MSSVYYSSAYNSTHFTTCCRVAITATQHKCPQCRKDVYPYYEGMSDQERNEIDNSYYGSRAQRARDSRAGSRGHY